MPQTPLPCRGVIRSRKQALLVAPPVLFAKEAATDTLTCFHSVRWFLSVPKLILTAMGRHLSHERAYLDTSLSTQT